jgi:hypothetical protein
MYKKKSEIDIVNEVLEECILAYPVSSFIISLYKQYQQRGNLSKKQLQGLHSKASQVKDMPVAKLATLEALIKKMHTKYKSDVPASKPLYEKEKGTGQIIEAILAKYPHHKRVLFIKSKYDNNEPLSQVEMNDLKRFKQLLTKEN